jgi:hypothetical protein
MLEGEYELAAALLREIRDEQTFASHNFSKAFIDLEISYCRANSGDLAGAENGLPALSEQDFDHFDVDEQLVAAWIKQKLAELDSRFGDPVEAKLLTESAAEAYQAMMGGLSSKLSEFTQ